MRQTWLMMLCSTMLNASSYCAYEVKVRDPTGAPFANAPVGVVDGGTQRTTVVTDANGLARFCDEPLHAVDFVVGTRGCGVVLIKAVKPTWPETKNIFITYDKTHCDGELLFPHRCQILLRIHDQEGHPLGGAEFDFGQSESASSDAFGRIFRSIQSGENLNGMVKMNGRESTRISARCVRGDERDVEENVVLRKSRK